MNTLVRGPFMVDTKLNLAFGKVLHNLRIEHDLSQEKLSFECNLHRTYISQLESGLKTPTLLTIQKISRVFSIKGSEFVRLVENELEPKKAVTARKANT